MAFITGICKIVIEIILTKAEIKEHYSLTGKRKKIFVLSANVSFRLEFSFCLRICMIKANDEWTWDWNVWERACDSSFEALRVYNVNKCLGDY